MGHGAHSVEHRACRIIAFSGPECQPGGTRDGWLQGGARKARGGYEGGARGLSRAVDSFDARRCGGFRVRPPGGRRADPTSSRGPDPEAARVVGNRTVSLRKSRKARDDGADRRHVEHTSPSPGSFPSLSLWERVGVRAVRTKRKAGPPSPGLRPPSPKGRGFVSDHSDGLLGRGSDTNMAMLAVPSASTTASACQAVA